MAIKFLSHPGIKTLVRVQEILKIKLLICYININMLNIIPNIIPKSKSQLCFKDKRLNKTLRMVAFNFKVSFSPKVTILPQN